MSDRIWVSATVFCTDPVATGRFYAAFGLSALTVDDGVVEVSPKAGPVLRLVKAEVPSRTYIGLRAADLAAAELGLRELGVWCEPTYPGVLFCRDPDGNAAYALLPRRDNSPEQIIIWKVFVTDVNHTMWWFSQGLGLSTSDADDRIVVVGNPPVGEPDDVWVHFGDQPSMLLYPRADKRVTETALSIQVPRLTVVADRLDALQWRYDLKGPTTLVTRSPDEWLVRLNPPAGGSA